MFDNFLSLFRKRSPRVIAQAELEDTQRSLLELQAEREYYESMVKCAETRIERLTNYLQGE